ncbi:MAG: ribonuclease [Devosia sp.]
MKALLAFVVLAFLALVGPALAETKLSGSFVAKQACPALQSIKKQTNPGNVTLEVGKAYKLVGGNKVEPTYYWVVVPTAQPDFRWVPVSCGTPALDQADAAPTPASPISPAPSPSPPPAGKAEYILAISWEPAFCEGLPNKTECKRQTAGSYEATHLSLHGLWPQPRSKAYCKVSAADQASDKAHDWDALPAVNLSTTTRPALDRAMPGTQSALERHEWIVHGTCSGASQDVYFSRAVFFLDTINNSAVGTLLAKNVGKQLDNADIRAAFDTAFGSGAGDRIRLACDQDGGRRIVSEITIGLRGDVMGNGSLGELIAASGKTDPGCTGGIVDPAGLQ